MYCFVARGDGVPAIKTGIENVVKFAGAVFEIYIYTDVLIVSMWAC